MHEYMYIIAAEYVPVVFQTTLLYLVDNSLRENDPRDLVKLDHFHELGGHVSERDQVVGCV